jgi:hypothetical protein
MSINGKPSCDLCLVAWVFWGPVIDLVDNFCKCTCQTVAYTTDSVDTFPSDLQVVCSMSFATAQERAEA